MVLADDNVEEYIKLDLEKAAAQNDEDFTPILREALEKKRLFKQDLCQRISTIKWGYIYETLKLTHNEKASMLGAEAFAAKVKKLDTKERKSQFKKRG